MADLARAFPGITIVFDHTGSPLGNPPYSDHAAVFAEWRRGMEQIARHQNVVLKFGGLGMPVLGPPLVQEGVHPPSTALAELWRPWFEVCLDSFGPSRIMFESNYPADAPNGSYRTLWNAFKRLALPLSKDERQALFSLTAARAYQLEDVA